ncbi:hypothetical protein ACTL4S_06930 [Acinetobacter lwoffii]|uniref:hypothetical protein n=1 Tax=Acinetobacter lwoffii TaxID=28090 RepID=UPI003F8D8DC8
MDTLGTEAIRAFFTLQCCWLNNEEIYLEQGCPDCSSAATYLIYHTNTHIQKHLLKFIEKYRCHQARRNDLLDLDFFQKDYEDFLHILENEVNFYARLHHDVPRDRCFEEIESIFERHYAMAY